jgi:hypothetical protein
MPDRKVNIVKVMARAFGASERAVMCMVTHGQVYIDGHCIQPQWLNHWTEVQLYGRVLKCPAGEMRFLGSRLMRDYEQTRMV